MESTSSVKNSDGPAGMFAGMDPRCVPLVLCTSEYLLSWIGGRTGGYVECLHL